jgi:hypothetical protein
MLNGVAECWQGAGDMNILLQLPYFDHDVVKKIGRKKVSSVAELAAMDPEERLELFVMSGAAAASAVVVIWTCQ